MKKIIVSVITIVAVATIPLTASAWGCGPGVKCPTTTTTASTTTTTTTTLAPSTTTSTTTTTTTTMPPVVLGPATRIYREPVPETLKFTG